MSIALLAALVLGAAAPASSREVPAVLDGWRDWVLHGEARCPFLHGSEVARCDWPGRLELKLDEREGRFNQAFLAYREAFVALPGDASRWPQEVLVDGRPAVVVPDAAGRPTVQLAPGEHLIGGSFAWDSMPETLMVSPETGLVALTVRGKPVALPTRDGDGRLFLQKADAPAEAQRLEIAVHRRLIDEVPLQLVTRISLEVSGKSREAVLGPALPDGFVPMSLTSELPARIEEGGRLRVQVRAGRWAVEVGARHKGPVASIARPAAGAAWSQEDEIWVFDARPSLRQVLVEGVPAIDPQQTGLPGEWKHLPAYAVAAKDSVILTERRRGDADPSPDVLNLNRSLWLDFDGNGFTASDRIEGQLHRAWRLEVAPPTELGRVVAAGADQPITRLGPGEPAGVELRQGVVSLEADSRIAGPVGSIPAVSWVADFNRVQTSLHLPPGWRLFAASGADHVPSTWLDAWTLLDIFLVLVIALAVGRLWGWRWGAVALATLVLSWRESDVPQYAWLVVLVFEALGRVLPDGRALQAVRSLGLAARAALAILLVTFMVQHVRHALYPALALDRQLGGVKTWTEYSNENSAQYARSFGSFSSSNADALSGEAEPPQEEDEAAQVQQQAAPAKSLQKRSRVSLNIRDYDKNAMVQTGPGLPRWEWVEIPIAFSGPVQRGQVLELWLLGPRGNLALAGLRVILLGLLALCVLGLAARVLPPSIRRWLEPRPPPTRPASSGPAAGVAGLFAAMALTALAGPARAQAVPPDEMLGQLKERLLEKPKCAPSCAASPRMRLEAKGNLLRLRVEIHAAAQTAVPLPGGAQHWLAEQIQLDGRPASGLRREPDGALWLALPEGAHQVVMEGSLGGRDTVQIALPLRPHRVEAALEGWTLDGLHEDGLADENLQLSRKASAEPGAAPGASLDSGNVTPFVSIERTLVLGLQWEVETTVRRLTPTGSAVVLEVPLLAGESVTSSEVRVQGGKALVNMPSPATEVSWASMLEARSPIELEAPPENAWVEVWRLDASPLWHLGIAGIPMVHRPEAVDVRVPEWHPWPGEAVRIEVSKPEGVQGQTLTIDQSSMRVEPGARVTDVTFTANMRSSRGELHGFTLPESAQLQSAKVNGVLQPIRQEGRRVAIALTPGSQSVELAWRELSAVGTTWRSPDFGLGTSAANLELEVQVPRDRWVLWVSGPRMGPAVLFWSFLLVLMALCVGLGRQGWTPLKVRHWVLLAVGLSQVPIVAIAFVFGWLLLLGWRERTPELGRRGWFNLRQVVIVAMTAVALGILASSVYSGLLGQPEMQIEGNGSGDFVLRWFQDRTAQQFPSGFVFSLPMRVYRFAMLAWSLWMAVAILRWLKWGWRSFAAGGLWSRKPAVLATSIAAGPGGTPGSAG